MKRTVSIFRLISIASMLCGCQTMHPAQPPNVPVKDVIDQLKYELAVFAADTEGKTFFLKEGVRCGSSAFSMTIKTVEVKLTSAITYTSGVSAGLNAPIPIGAITLGPTAGFSDTTRNSQDITLTFTPVNGTFKEARRDNLPIADALFALRDQLLAVGKDGQCLAFASAQKNEISLAFTAERDGNEGIRFKLIVLSLDANASQKARSGNTVTVALDFGSTIEGTTEKK